MEMKFTFYLGIYHLQWLVIFIVKIHEIVSINYDNSFFERQKLGTTLTTSNQLCQPIQLTGTVSRTSNCYKICNEDESCKFFQYLTSDSLCILCTTDVEPHSEYVELDLEEFIAENKMTDVFKNWYRIRNAATGSGNCSLVPGKSHLIRDCSYAQTKGGKLHSGVYTVHVSNESVPMYCDMHTDGGGWTVFQRRIDGSEDFTRDWDDYENGFGDLNSEFWLGNKHIAAITAQGDYELRIELGSFEWTYRYAQYSNFKLDANDLYRISFGSMIKSNTGDSFSYINGMKFSTPDSDNDNIGDRSCAAIFSGGWWYNFCHLSHLNGLYLQGSGSVYKKGVVWLDWLGYTYSLRFTEMKLRPISYVIPNSFYNSADNAPPARDCGDLFLRGETGSGVYSISTTGREQHTFNVYCDMSTDGGGWLVFQKRFDGSLDFFRNWIEYQLGFGSLEEEFWLGLDKLSYVTEQGPYEVRFDLMNNNNVKRFAFYDAFSVNRDDLYRLDIGSYSGDAGESMFERHQGMQFSTFDADHDTHDSLNCAERYSSAWWYRACHYSNLNGLYGSTVNGEGINWFPLTGHTESLKQTAIKIRPVGFNN